MDDACAYGEDTRPVKGRLCSSEPPPESLSPPRAAAPKSPAKDRRWKWADLIVNELLLFVVFPIYIIWLCRLISD